MKEHKKEIGELWHLMYHSKFECIIKVEKISSYEPEGDNNEIFFIRGIIVDVKETDSTKIGDSVMFSWNIINHLTRIQIVSDVKRFDKLTMNDEPKPKRWWKK